MKILYFSREYTTHDRRFLSALAGAGVQVAYLALEQRGHSLEDRPLPAQVTQVQWAGGQGPISRKDRPRLLASLKRVLGEVQPDLVQAGPIQSAALLVALTGFRPLVSMSWGYDLIFDAQRGPLWRWATRYTLSRSAVMVGDCATIRRLAVSYGMPDERIITFPWGIELEHFNFRPRSASNQEIFTLLSVRGWEPIYGVDVLARAFVQAVQKRPELRERLRLVMLGNGSQAGLLRQIFTQGGVMDQVVFPGQISQSELARFYQAADLYISASHSDGTSISLLEAMACGAPVLISDIPGNREWITPGEQGWLFSDGDSDDLCRGILRAVDERSRLSQMGCAARKLVEERGDWQKNFPQLLEAYNLALKVSR